MLIKTGVLQFADELFECVLNCEHFVILALKGLRILRLIPTKTKESYKNYLRLKNPFFERCTKDEVFY